MAHPSRTLLFIGGNPARGTYEQHIEVYSPAYLFNPDGILQHARLLRACLRLALAMVLLFKCRRPMQRTFLPWCSCAQVRRRMLLIWNSASWGCRLR